MNSATIKFNYFPFNARGAITRAILSASKVEWENHIITMQEWPTVKKSGFCEFSQLPVLEFNGKKYSQSMAMELFLARHYNLIGKTTDEEYQVISLLCTFDDLFPLVHKIAMPKTEELKKNLESNRTQFIEKYKFYLKKIEERYVNNGKKNYFLGDHFTLADIYIAVIAHSFVNVMNGKDPIKETAPALYALIERVKEKELKEYFDKYFIKDSVF